MKEIGKLIELLNEFEENRPMELPRQYRRKEMPTFKGGLVAISEYDDEMVDNSDLLVVSKFDGFIKWLVENDKIDMIILGKIGMYGDLEQCRINTTNAIIMILSITENPIEFLISILK